MLTFYWSTKVFSFETFPLYGIKHIKINDDDSGNILSWNQTACPIVGYAWRQEWILY